MGLNREKPKQDKKKKPPVTGDAYKKALEDLGNSPSTE